MRIAEEQARALVRARLGREPADFLESAVVLEAWGGLRATTALDVAPRWRRAEDEPTTYDSSAVKAPVRPRGAGWLVVGSVLGTASYLLMLHRHLPAARVDAAWRAALPIGLAWQWVIRRRYQAGTRSLTHDRRTLGWGLLLAVMLVVVSGVQADLLTGLLLLPWCAAALVAGTPRAIRYAAVLGAASAVSLVVTSPQIAIATPSLIAILVVVHAMVYEAGASALTPAPWKSALPAVMPGFALGLLILAAPVGNGSITGFAAVAALLPSLLGNHAAGVWLRRLWDGDASPAEVVMRALAILAVVTVLGSVVIVAGSSALGAVDVSHLAGMLSFLLLVAVLTFPVILLDAFRFDATLMAIGTGTIALMATGGDAPRAVLATVVAFAVSMAVLGRLLRDGNRLRAMPG